MNRRAGSVLEPVASVPPAVASVRRRPTRWPRPVALAPWPAGPRPAKSHIDQRLHWIGRVLDEFGGEFHVLLGGEVGHQIVELKHESDVVAPVIGQLLRVEVRDVDAVDDDLAFGIRVHAAQDVEHRRFAGSG